MMLVATAKTGGASLANAKSRAYKTRLKIPVGHLNNREVCVWYVERSAWTAFYVERQKYVILRSHYLGLHNVYSPVAVICPRRPAMTQNLCSTISYAVMMIRETKKRQPAFT